MTPSISPFIIPLFIPHSGCPHRCLFCNQEAITGQKEPLSLPEQVGRARSEIDCWLGRKGRRSREVQVSFYGGSFTGLPLEWQDTLLQTVAPYLADGRVDAIRLSTRPDYIQPETAAFLYSRGVRTVELGVQSLDPVVLEKSHRGHNVSHVVGAIKHLRKRPLKIGAQLMVGLPGETTTGLIKSAHGVAALRPDMIRIYPVLVVRGSGLEGMYRSGDYQPLSLQKAIIYTAGLKKIFEAADIPIIRMGLQATDDLQAQLVAGPYHPAFGELVLSRLLFCKARNLLSGKKKKTRHCLHVAMGDESLFRGQKSASLKRLQQLGLLEDVELVFDAAQKRGSLSLCSFSDEPAFQSINK